MNRRLEVRCCCIPGKLLGWYDVPQYVQLKDGVSFQTFYLTPVISEPVRDIDTPIEIATLTLCNFTNEAGRTYLAIKDNGIPWEKLKRLRDFIPVRNYEN